MEIITYVAIEILTYIAIFLAWVLVLYCAHRICHVIPFLKKIHLYHHDFINTSQPQWDWKNIFLWTNDFGETMDLWVTEGIPTLAFCTVTGHWWIFVWWWIWAGLIEQFIEHNPKFDVPFLSAGKHHLQHHKYYNVNYSTFFPLWDWVLGTYKDRNTL